MNKTINLEQMLKNDEVRLIRETERNYYYIDRNGNYYSQRKDNKNVRQGKPSLGKRGYYRACIGGKKRIPIHRLVVEAFIATIPDGMAVNHIDGNKLNNNVENLEIVTIGDNIRHAYETGLNKGKKKVLNEQQVQEIMTLFKSGEFIQARIAEKYNVSKTVIKRVTEGTY